MKALPAISVRNAQRKIRLDPRVLSDFARRALARASEVPGAVVQNLRGIEEISVVLVSDRRMAGLHERFMKVSGPTDVLTFQHGEIIISVETAQRNAHSFGTGTAREIRLYLIHGLLHLLGFDDQEPAAARRMATVQERILRALEAA